MKAFIHQQNDWPQFRWNIDEILSLLSEARNLQGRLLGKMESLGFELRNEALLETLTLDVLKSSEIEGEILNQDQVRSSIARRLGVEIAGSVEADRNVEGVVEMMLDATQNCFEPLTDERLFDWHAALFPTGRSGMYKITVANWRVDGKGPMQVVSGAMGKEKVHFQAPDSSLIEKEMKQFINWFNESESTDLLIKAAIAHLWFVTIHPFDDGNGRIARAISDLLLARSEKSSQRFYSLSNQILIEKKKYYEILQKVQHSSGDITEWIDWFLNCMYRALENTEETLKRVLKKADFWDKHKETLLNSRQRLMLNKILDGFEGKLKSSKWAKIAKCSADTALRDIKDLIEKRILKQEESGGRSTNYELVEEWKLY